MRLTDEQRESLAKADGADLVDAIVACILRLDEEVEPVHPSHLTTVVENLECERDEARAARDEALAVRANQEATIEDLGEALASAIDERDAALADLDALARAVAQALMVPTLNDREELVDPSDHAIVGAMLGMRNARDTALARLAKVEAERPCTPRDVRDAILDEVIEYLEGCHIHETRGYYVNAVREMKGNRDE